MMEGAGEELARSGGVGAVYLVFSRSRRPDRPALIEAAEAVSGLSVSHDPFGRDYNPDHARGRARSKSEETWLELLQWGMTFDCLGLAPGPAVSLPAIEHRLNIPVDQDLGSFEALALSPGPHLADAANSLPVVRALLDMAASLAGLLDGVEAVCWGPARTAMPPKFFRSAVASWIEGGPFPALCLAGFQIDPEGRLRTDGMDWFLGREIVLSTELSLDRSVATRIALRLIHEIVAMGRLDHRIEMSTEDGLSLSIEPVDANLIEVNPM